ncbi:uncharacterized protein LOC113209412 [Frankliniella occidentalis]|uniref:Uncharacterized protein LOC113209412 n=1 Tax=Frankliniella occidentalis TaxID=133901 RepID=A0A6J1STN2_FRAOC|nr:uncharacterized protein LOC113209412 [Frankliniella occidentalis]
MKPKCCICFLNYDMDNYRPKCLPCGHTICQDCVLNPALERKCPTCKKDVTCDPSDLPDNFLVIQMMEDEDSQSCKNSRTEDPVLEQLQRGADAGRKVVEMLRLVVPQAVEVLNRQLESSFAQLGQVEKALERRVQREAAGDVGTPSDAVEEPLQLAEQLEASHRLLTSTKCTVTAEEEGGSSWTASVQPGGCGDMLRVLLLQLRADGQLGEVDDDATVLATPASAYVGPPSFSALSISEHVSGGRLNVNEILQTAEEQWDVPRSLLDLQGEGADDLLRVVGANIVELKISGDAEPKVMVEVEKLSALKYLEVACAEGREYPDLPLQLEELDICNITENQLRCVQRMPGLSSLQIHSYHGPNMTLPPSQYGRLLWLGVTFDTDHKSTMLSLIRANASSLRELHVCCAPCAETDTEYYFPDLGQELAPLGLRVLRRLVLARPEASWASHPFAKCVLQRRAVQSFFPKSVEVVCGFCHTPALF